MVDYSSLENCRAARHRGFESLSLRDEKVFIRLLRDRHLFSYTIIKLDVFISVVFYAVIRVCA